MIFPAETECLNSCSKDGAVMLPPADTLRLGSDQIQSCVEGHTGGLTENEHCISVTDLVCIQP